MCFQRLSERIEGESRSPQSGWKVIRASLDVDLWPFDLKI